MLVLTEFPGVLMKQKNCLFKCAAGERGLQDYDFSIQVDDWLLGRELLAMIRDMLPFKQLG